MGRLRKRWKVGLVGVASLALLVATVPLAIWVTHTSGAQLENARRRCERGVHSAHTVLIKNGAAVPVHTETKLCDSLTITNLDNKDRLMAFGKHDNHISYDGISERNLGQGQSIKVTLIKAGTFLFHDHTDDSVQGTFTVTN